MLKPFSRTRWPSRSRNSSKAGPAVSLLYISSSVPWPARQYRTPTLCWKLSCNARHAVTRRSGSDELLAVKLKQQKDRFCSQESTQGNSHKQTGQTAARAAVTKRYTHTTTPGTRKHGGGEQTPWETGAARARGVRPASETDRRAQAPARKHTAVGTRKLCPPRSGGCHFPSQEGKGHLESRASPLPSAVSFPCRYLNVHET